MIKSELRTFYLQKRNQLTENDLEAASLAISESLFRHFSFENKTVSIFLSIANKKELDTLPILEKLIQLKCCIVVSKTLATTTEMELYLYEGKEQLLLSPYGIPEPKYGKIISPNHIDIILVPLLCVDSNGYRVGYGKGYYDRFLAQCKKESLIIGLGLFNEFIVIDDLDEFDIPLDYYVTPSELYSFRKND